MGDVPVEKEGFRKIFKIPSVFSTIFWQKMVT
jgi:hypothetical protein